MEGKRALITGISGFTGQYMAQELAAAGYRVFGTAQAARSAGPAGAECFALDLCERQAVADLVAQIQPDVVVHLAAISFVAHADTSAIYRVNIVGTRNLLEALGAVPHRPQAVLLASSANIYGNANVEPIDENVPPAPANDYAVSKLAMEYMARLWCDKLPIIFARPFNYTGVGQSESFLLPKIVAHFRRGATEIELGNLDVARDFSDVRMVAACYRRLIERGVAGQTVNICSGIGTSLLEVIGMLERIAGYRIAVKVNPAFVRANEVKRLVGCNAKLTQLVGPLAAIPLADTLQWMVRA